MKRDSNQLKNIPSFNIKNNNIYASNPKINDLSNSPSLNSIMSIDLTSSDHLIQRAKDTISKFQDEENNMNNSKKLHKRNVKENLLIKTDDNFNSSQLLTNVVTEEEYKKKNIYFRISNKILSIRKI